MDVEKVKDKKMCGGCKGIIYRGNSSGLFAASFTVLREGERPANHTKNTLNNYEKTFL